MLRPTRHRRILFVAALAALALRALTPDGYMPGSAGSGLLYELCPNGMPPAVMAALNGAAGHHHHHHGGADDSASVTGTEQCPIGHMLASAVAIDVGAPADLAPDVTIDEATPAEVVRRWHAATYRSRAPPA